MTAAIDEDYVKIVNIPRLILTKSGKRGRNKDNSEVEKVEPEMKTKKAVTLPPINDKIPEYENNKKLDISIIKQTKHAVSSR